MAPLPTNPAGDAPQPPSGNFRVEVVRIAFESGGESLTLRFQPQVPGVQVAIMN